MEIIETRKLLGQINNYLENVSLTLREEDIANLKEIASFLKLNIIDNMADTFEGIELASLEILTIISSFLDAETIIKILRSIKLRKIFKEQEIIIFWQQLQENEQVTYLLEANYISEKDYFLLQDLLEKGGISFADVKEKISKFSLNFNLSDDIMRNNLDLFSTEVIVNYLNKQDLDISQIDKKILKVIPNNSLKFKVIPQDIKEIFNSSDLLAKLDYQVLAKLYGANKIREMALSNPSKAFLGALYILDKFKYKQLINQIFESLNPGVIINNCYDLLDNKEKLKKDYSLLLKFAEKVIAEIVEEDFTEEEIVMLLRSQEFVEAISPELLKQIMTNLNFSTVFNLLQNNLIYSKSLMIKCFTRGDDKSLVKGFLDTVKFYAKLDKGMGYKLLSMLDYEDVINYLKRPYILNNLNEEEIVSLLCIKNINIEKLFNEEGFKGRITRELLINYINEMWNISVDLDLIKNPELFKLLFNLDDEAYNKLNLADINYLFTTVYNKENLALYKSNISVLSYKTIIIAYKMLGISNTLNILFNSKDSLTLEDVREYHDLYLKDKLDKYLENDGAVLNNLEDKIIELLEIYENPLEEKDTTQGRIKTVINGLTSYGVDYQRLVKMMNRYIDYRKINQSVAEEEIKDSISTIKEEILNSYQNKWHQEFMKKAINILKLKKSVYQKNIKNVNKEWLLNIKLKLLYSILQNKTRLEGLFKSNLNEGKKLEELKEELKKRNISLDDYLENILLPLSDKNLDIYKYLNMEIPDNYDKYLETITARENLQRLNKYLIKFSYIYEEQELKKIALNIINGDEQLPSKIRKDVKACQEIVRNIKFEIYYNERNKEFELSNIINAYQDSLSDDYYQKYVLIEELVDYTKHFVKSYFRKSFVYQYYYDKFDNYENEDIMSEDLKDYEIKKQIFRINDLENILAGIDIQEAEKVDEELIEGLNKINYWPVAMTGLISDGEFYLNNYHEGESYLKANNYDISTISKEDLIKIKQTLIKNKPWGMVKSFYQRIMEEDILKAYGQLLKNNQKMIGNLHVSRDNYNVSDMQGWHLVEELLALYNSERDVVNCRKLLARIADTKVTYYLVRHKQEKVGIVESEILGNSVILKKDIGTVSKDLMNDLAEEILDNYLDIDYVYYEDDVITREGFYKVNKTKVYYGDYCQLNSSVYQMDSLFINQSLLKMLKLNYGFNRDSMTFEEPKWEDFTKIEFDNYNVAIYQGDKAKVKVNQESEYFKKLQSDN